MNSKHVVVVERARDGNTDHGDQALVRLVAICRGLLSVHSKAGKILEGNGITDESIWNRYRIGASGKEVVAQLDAADREALIGAGYHNQKGATPMGTLGIVLPTYDPTEPKIPVGIVKLKPVQNKHIFVGPAKGIVFPLGNDDPDGAVVICDHPLLMLRLAMAGCKGAVLAETPEVLEPYRDWLRFKQIVLVSRKKQYLKKYSALLEKMDVTFTVTSVPTELSRTTPEDVELLGLSKKPKIPAKKQAKITPRLVRELVAYAQRRLQDGHGLDLLKVRGADDGELIKVLGLGYLPDDYKEALDGEDKEAVGHKLLAGSLILPALDERGVPIDFVAIQRPENHRQKVPLLDEPQGLLCSKVPSVFPEIIVTNSFTILAKLWKLGVQNVILIRNEQDAKNNAERIKKSSVKSIRLLYWKRVHEDPAAKLFKANGLDVSRIQMPYKLEDLDSGWAKQQGLLDDDDPEYPDPDLVDNDERTERATYQSGDVTYSVETAPEAESHLEVIAERNDKSSRDRFDLASESQRVRFAESAGAKLGVPHKSIAKHLVSILESVQQIQRAALLPDAKEKVVVLEQNEKDEAETYLKRPDLLDAIAGDLETVLGTGDKASLLLYMVATSRKLRNPISITVRPASRFGNIAELMPQEDVVRVSPMASLDSHRNLQNKLLAVSETNALRKRERFALRLLRSRGSLSSAVMEPEAKRRRTVTRQRELSGPVGIVASDNKEMGFLEASFDLNASGSERKEEVMQLQRKLKADPKAVAERQRVIEFHQNIQRIIEPYSGVLIPFAKRIAVDAGPSELEAILSLTSAVALLHQYQRLKQDGYILATEGDFEIAKDLADGLFAIENDEISSNARNLLAKLSEWELEKFTLSDLAKQDASWSRSRYLRTLDELIKIQMVSSPSRGRGNVREYELVEDACVQAPAVRISLESDQGKLSKLFRSCSGDLNTFIPAEETG